MYDFPKEYCLLTKEKCRKSPKMESVFFSLIGLENYRSKPDESASFGTNEDFYTTTSRLPRLFIGREIRTTTKNHTKEPGPLGKEGPK